MSRHDIFMVPNKDSLVNVSGAWGLYCPATGLFPPGSCSADHLTHAAHRCVSCRTSGGHWLQSGQCTASPVQAWPGYGSLTAGSSAGPGQGTHVATQPLSGLGWGRPFASCAGEEWGHWSLTWPCGPISRGSFTGNRDRPMVRRQPHPLPSSLSEH